MQNFLSFFISFLLISSCSEKTQAQKNTRESELPIFIEASQNVISNASSMNPFFEKLKEQSTHRNQKISIVHIGDSHIQQDMMTSVLRKSFQETFGNAGRGLIVPLKIAKTNEPFDYVSSSNTDWGCRKVIRHTADIEELGLGGLTLKSSALNSSIDIKINNRYGINYAFDKVRLFYGKEKQNFEPIVKDSLGNEVALSDEIASFSNPSYRFSIQNKKTEAHQNCAEWFGMSLEKNENGVLYHAVGINGARFRDYALEPSILLQMSQLDPDLMIISLGTNEAQKNSLTYDAFYLQIDSMMKVVKMYHPNTPILLTTPAGSYRNGVANPSLSIVNQAIIAYAMANNFAYWDIYGISGGEKSAENWKNAALLGKDGVHFTQNGYETLGATLFQAFEKMFLF